MSMSFRFLECLVELSFLEKQCFWKQCIKFIDYFQVLCFVSVSGNDLCLGPSTFLLDKSKGCTHAWFNKCLELGYL